MQGAYSVLRDPAETLHLLTYPTFCLEIGRTFASTDSAPWWKRQTNKYVIQTMHRPTRGEDGQIGLFLWTPHTLHHIPGTFPKGVYLAVFDNARRILIVWIRIFLRIKLLILQTLVIAKLSGMLSTLLIRFHNNDT